VQTIDIDAAGTVLGPETIVDAENCSSRDDGTITRRPGLWSYHVGLNTTGSALEALPLTTNEVLGLKQFDRVKNAGNRSTIYLAKVDDYIVGSRYGRIFDLKIHSGLGAQAIPDFTEVYHSGERRQYLVVCSNDDKFVPHYWDGTVNTDLTDFEYMKRLEGSGYQAFSVFHNNRLYMAGGADPYRVIFSDDQDFLNFGGGGFFVLNPQFGRITGFFKTFYGELIIGQERAISQVSADNTRAQPISTEVGLANNRCAVQIGNDFLFIGTDGQVHSLATTDRFGDILTGAKSHRVYRQFDEGPLGGVLVRRG
jgi:hypothetical protein